jgi:crossover junction endodeoxyribonuclease RuvC
VSRAPAARILGIDPGSRIVGWGLVSEQAGKPELLDCGVIRLTAEGPLASRLVKLYGELDALVQRTQPTVAAVETLFHGRNARSALTLAAARGVILVVLARAGLEIAEYSPASVKQAVTGSGRADKEQVRVMVSRLLRSTQDLGPHDLSDALAVALCHQTSASFHSAVERTGSPG